MSGGITLLPLRALMLLTETTLPFCHTCFSPGTFRVFYLVASESRQQGDGRSMKMERQWKETSIL